MEMIYGACLYHQWFHVQHYEEPKTSPKPIKLCWVRRQSSDTWNNRKQQPVPDWLRVWQILEEFREQKENQRVAVAGEVLHGGLELLWAWEDGSGREKTCREPDLCQWGHGDRDEPASQQSGLQTRAVGRRGERQRGWRQEWPCRRHVLGSYMEAKDYYPHSEHTGVCSEQQYEPFVQKTKTESK